MSIFTRIRQTRLAPENKIIETKTLPSTPLPEPTPIIQRVHICAFCGNDGATCQFVNGDLYLKRLPHNYLCSACWDAREAARTRHNVANMQTVEEHKSVVPKRPRVRSRVERREETESLRKPSRPLEDFAMNLAEATEGDLLTFADAANYVDVTWATFQGVCGAYGIKPVEGTELYRRSDLEQARTDACTSA